MRLNDVNRPGKLQMGVKYLDADVTGFEWGVTIFLVMDMWSRWHTGAIATTYYRSEGLKALKSILESMPQKLLDTIDYIQTDGGPYFRGEFHDYVTNELGWEHQFVKKSDNSALQRCYRTDLEEFFWYIDWPINITALTKGYQQHIDRYNTFRPHQNLDYQTPQEKLNSYVDSNNDVIAQLEKLCLSVELAKNTPSLIDSLGSEAQAAITNIDLTNSYKYTYEVSGSKIGGFMVVPKNTKESMPVIIYCRDGVGNKGLVLEGELLTRMAELAKQGYVVIGSQYSGNSLSEGSDEYGGNMDIDCVITLKNIIDQLSFADDNRIGVMGVGRGGMMVYTLMSKVDWVKASITFNGVANLDRALQLCPKMSQVFQDAFGNTEKGRDQRSAVNWAEKMDNAPLFLIHDANDDKVSPMDSLELATKLQESNHQYQLNIVNYETDGPKGKLQKFDQHALEWLGLHLKNPVES